MYGNFLNRSKRFKSFSQISSRSTLGNTSNVNHTSFLDLSLFTTLHLSWRLDIRHGSFNGLLIIITVLATRFPPGPSHFLLSRTPKFGRRRARRTRGLSTPSDGSRRSNDWSGVRGHGGPGPCCHPGDFRLDWRGSGGGWGNMFCARMIPTGIGTWTSASTSSCNTGQIWGHRGGRNIWTCWGCRCRRRCLHHNTSRDPFDVSWYPGIKWVKLDIYVTRRRLRILVVYEKKGQIVFFWPLWEYICHFHLTGQSTEKNVDNWHNFPNCVKNLFCLNSSTTYEPVIILRILLSIDGSWVRIHHIHSC